jgi:hypothetical protein
MNATLDRPARGDERSRIPTEARRIEALARAIVDTHEHFLRRADRFEFRFRKGRLLVKGCVPSFYLKQQLQSALRDIVTYCPIDNQVSVVSGFGLSSVSALEG